MRTFTLALVMLCAIAQPVTAQTTDQVTTIAPAQTETTIKLKITGLTCSGDIKDIQKQVSALAGVASCIPARKPSATTLFEVKFNPALVSEKQIRQAVESTAGCTDPDSRPYKVKS